MKAQHWHSVGVSATLILLAALLGISIHIFSSHPSAKASQHPTGHVIMPLGDSITFGVGSARHTSYRLVLWQHLTQAGIKVSFVGSMSSGGSVLPQPANEGHSGWTIRQISAHIVDWLKAAHPDYVLLHIGTNDILRQDDLAHAPQRLHFLLDQITGTLPSVTVLVAQITPLSATFESQVETFNQAIPGIVSQEVKAGKRVEYVDVHDYVPLSDLPDKIHPNDAGYALMAKVWYQALYPLVK